jgi:hypothetical protein
MGFAHWLNYTFLAATAGIAALGPWSWDLPLAVGAGLEAFWLAVGTRLPPAREYFREQHATIVRHFEAARRRETLRGLTETDRRRYLELESLRKDIDAQIRSNPTLAMDLVKAELQKVDKLLETFVRLAANAARYEHYVETSELNQIEAEVRRQEVVLEKTSDPDARDLAQRNFDVLAKRLEKAIEIRKQIRTARAQLNLIDNTFRLIRDQILTMDSPQQLQGQLDELTRAVDTIEATGRETDELLQKMDREIASIRG